MNNFLSKVVVQLETSILLSHCILNLLILYAVHLYNLFALCCEFFKFAKKKKLNERHNFIKTFNCMMVKINC